MSPVRILIADDHAVFRRSLRTLIESRPDWRVCGEAVDGEDAIHKFQELQPDVVLMDVSMPRMNGLDATRHILQTKPDANVVVVSQNEPGVMEKMARQAGAKVFVPKSDIAQVLVKTVASLVKTGSEPAVWDETPSIADSSGPRNLIKARGTELLAQDTRERYRQKLARITLDSMVQFVGLLDANGTVLEINHVALDAVGIKLSDVESKPFWTTFWWQVSEEVNNELRDSIRRAAQGEFVRWDAEIYGRAGGKETIIIDASLMPVKDENGKVVFITAEGRDITEKKAHEREIARQREELAQLDELKTKFFANISHEFRTPLTLMMGPLEDAIAQPGELSPSNRDRVELAHRNSLRLLKLVNTLLDFSRIEAGRIEASYEPVDLASFTVELASMFRSAVERAGLRLVIDCQPLADPVYVDREMWEKIVFNLLSNAFKFTLVGEIEISLRKTEGAVKLVVRDTGTGIPAEDVPHLFERFYRVKGAQGRTFEGSGIGLALVQELAKLHGGTVQAESELNRGSQFVVTIPLGDGHLPADRIGARRTLASTGVRGEAFVQEALRWLPETGVFSDEPQPASSFASKTSQATTISQTGFRPRILLADDSADMRDYVQRLLEQHYEVLAVPDGEAALAGAREWRPHLILSDVMMPRLDGFELVQALRADESLKSIPIILLSARAGEESRIEGHSSGADDYLVKPFSARELQARVSSHLGIAEIRERTTELERKLRLDAERLAAIVASSDDAIVSKNLDGYITTWNKGAERIFGYTAKEAIGQHITLIIPAERRDEEADILARLRRGERVDHFQTVRVRKDGSFVDISVSVSPLRDFTGQVLGATKVARDITKQKLAEQALRESEERFRAIVETTPECVKLVARDGTVLHMNTSGLRMVGADCAEKVVGQSIYDVIAPEDRERFRAFNERVCQGERGSLEFDIVGLGGERRHMDTHAAPLHNPDGSVVQLAVTRDVTESERAEAALRESEERLRALAETLEGEVRARTKELEARNADVLKQSEQLRELSGRLLRTQDEERRHIARELHDSAGQTLTVLAMSVAQLVKKAGVNSPELSGDAESIQEIVQQLSREIRTASYLLHPPLLDEAGLSSALEWYIQGLSERSGLQIKLDVQKQIGRLPHDMELAVFRLVQECLTNIHRHSGSKTAAIRLTSQQDVLTIDIQDEGKGMSPARLAEIQSRGSGVGILGMRERLRQFHGDMHIKSGPTGTHVQVTIPIPGQSQTEEQKSAETLPAIR